MSENEPLKVLIVEDEALLAMELEALVEDAGHTVVGWATSSSQAREMVDGLTADIAFVDVHLTDGPTEWTSPDTSPKRRVRWWYS